jgi:hypothetical protein
MQKVIKFKATYEVAFTYSVDDGYEPDSEISLSHFANEVTIIPDIPNNFPGILELDGDPKVKRIRSYTRGFEDEEME